MFNRYIGMLAPKKIGVGILIFFLISIVVTDVSVKILLFPQGDFINFGLGGGLLRLLLSILTGLAIGYLLTSLVYFKVAKRFFYN
jgi:hypothetical protein